MTDRERGGLRAIDVAAVIVILTVTAFVGCGPLRQAQENQSDVQSCINNLKQMGIGLELYKQGPGKNRNWPRARGAAFVISLYTYEVIDDPGVFICPATDDSNRDKVEGDLYPSLPGDPNSVDSATMSYAGRDNLPDLPHAIRTTKGRAALPLICDDLETPGASKIRPNHLETVNVLYADYHVDSLDWKVDFQQRTDAIGPGGLPPFDALANE